jgi:bifunctional non-homologous end joining protein LigD
MVPDLAPMLADRGLPAGSLDAWSAEPKLDGWRVTVRVTDGQVLVRTRHGHALTEALRGIDALAHAGDNLLLDGELVAGAGRASDFYALAPRLAGRPRRRPEIPLSFWAFDLLYAQGELITGLPYAARRARLEALVLAEPCHILPRWPGTDAADLLDACAHLDVEGVVLKRLRSVYQPGVRSRHWRTMCSGGLRCHRRRGRVGIPA